MSVLKRLLALIRERRLDADLETEIAAHLELAEKAALDAGLSPAEARRKARLQFGGIAQVREEHRDRRSVRWIETFSRDLRHGLASLVRDPGFSAVAIGVLALGIGANTAMFSLVDAVLLRPLPFPEPQRIVRVWELHHTDLINTINTMDFLDWKRLNTVFDSLSVERDISLALTGEGEPLRLDGRQVSPDYFNVFGVSVARGRTFLAEEDQPAQAPVVVLTDAAWRSTFGTDPDILNREILLDGLPHTVVGVLPPSPFDRDHVAFFRPLIFRPDQMNRGYHWLRSVGRLKPGVTLEQAQQEMSSIDERLTEFAPTWKKDWGVTVEPYDRRLIDDGLRNSLPIAFGAVALVLLIACANVANLLLAKGAIRKGEMAVRAALGASRGRLVRQLLTESLVLCLLGTLAGVALAQLLIGLATPVIADSIPYTAGLDIDLRVLSFSAAATIVVLLLIGLLPSLQTSFTKLSQTMNQGARSGGGSREGLRRLIVVGEVAVSLLLVCGSLLLFKSLLNLQNVGIGVRTADVITMSIDLPPSSYSTGDSAISFYEAVVERLRATPGVAAAAVATDLPMSGVDQGQGIRLPGQDSLGGFPYKRIDANYLDALDIPLVAGRGIEARDSAGAPFVALINEQMAETLRTAYEVEDVVGLVISVSTPNFENSDGTAEDLEIVGVVRSERTANAPVQEQRPVIYVPLAQVPQRNVKLVLQTQGTPAAMMPGIREAIAQVDPSLPIGDILTIEQLRDRSLLGARQPTWVIGAFAFVAAFLAALGLYGVLAHTVTLQRREIGIRMALGARSSDVLSQVMRSGLALVGAGLILGVLGSFALTRVVQSMLFEVSPLDPTAIISASAAMLLVGLLAGLIPARRAARVQPMAVLREDG